ncbi:MAG: Protein translocase subunit SecA [Paracidovorax wautersii]|uniref:Protein translocase subunit SecA n=1 Tax=Paracidovorax wautersii TaxID=1177982 RepID=A0A7V8FKN4_9BURK|nr:MAG: Protein translocase subunit SecA [Paracidovorax wautersii]
MTDSTTPITADDGAHDYIEELEDLLDAAREQLAELPQWEFCDGFLAALVCTRRAIPADEWEPPRKDAETAGLIEDALAIVNELTEDDAGPYTISGMGDDFPPGMSEDRLDLFGEAIWACYDLRALWKSIGPRVLQVRRAPEPGRNDACPCGSGKKYKQCHGR